VARYARRRRLIAHAKDTVELFAFAYDTGVGPAVSKDPLKCVAFPHNASSTNTYYTVSKLTDPSHPCAAFTVTSNTNMEITCSNNPKPNTITGVIGSEHSSTVFAVTITEYAVEIVALSDYPRIIAALAKNSLKSLALPDNTTSAGTDYTISAGRVFTFNAGHFKVRRCR